MTVLQVAKKFARYLLFGDLLMITEMKKESKFEWVEFKFMNIIIFFMTMNLYILLWISGFISWCLFCFVEEINSVCCRHNYSLPMDSWVILNKKRFWWFKNWYWMPFILFTIFNIKRFFLDPFFCGSMVIMKKLEVYKK